MNFHRSLCLAAARFLGGGFVALAGCAWQIVAQAPAPAAPPLTNSYLRVGGPDTNTVELQIAVRQLLPPKEGAPVLWLVGASHIGETNYYAALQKHLDAQALVLFEGVQEQSARGEGEGRDGEAPAPGRKMEADESSLQFTLAKSLGLAFQLSAIRYDRPHFRNSDMTLEQIARVLSGGRARTSRAGDPAAGSSAQSSREFAVLMQVMDGGTFLGAMANGIARLLGSSPKLQAMTKLMLVELLGNLQDDIAEMGALPPDLKRLLTVLLHARNGVVLRDIKAELNKAEPAKSIAVFYGAAHLSDLEKRIRDELNYRAGEEQWLPAISVRLPDAGLTDADLQLVRHLVKWQMRLLQQPRTSGDSP